ncbi:protein PHLOEM PROTEIN 2-LIKE A1-like [Mangifera indica]|uniref:protein PHLOEM PROTEIN 2-LIKE A1-like n=1 Tax=Mangifera indica TaxID=29780 RepID=UPI001CFC2A52|nr:protein PHLOEM PROTEIN 2-LIKE A1-like [Mangifera indica]
MAHEVTQTRVKLPIHNYESILEEAVSHIDSSSSIDKLYDQLYSGIFLNQMKKKFWVDKLSHKNCFMLFARELSYPKGTWFLHSMTHDSLPRVDVAELQDSQSFEVKGKFNTMNLTPASLYQVSFTLMMKDEAENGWEEPVNLKLFLPNETSEVRKEYLNKKVKNQWVEILVGTFTTTYMDSGDIEFSMYDFGKRVKKGLVILGAVIKPFSFR